MDISFGTIYQDWRKIFKDGVINRETINYSIMVRVEMKKFGTLLNSRPAGREAALRIFQIVNGYNKDEDMILDFKGVEILTPSFADELINMLYEKYQNRKIKLENQETATVQDTIKSIQERRLVT